MIRSVDNKLEAAIVLAIAGAVTLAAFYTAPDMLEHAAAWGLERLLDALAWTRRNQCLFAA